MHIEGPLGSAHREYKKRLTEKISSVEGTRQNPIRLVEGEPSPENEAVASAVIERLNGLPNLEHLPSAEMRCNALVHFDYNFTDVNSLNYEYGRLLEKTDEATPVDNRFDTRSDGDHAPLLQTPHGDAFFRLGKFYSDMVNPKYFLSEGASYDSVVTKVLETTDVRNHEEAEQLLRARCHYIPGPELCGQIVQDLLPGQMIDLLEALEKISRGFTYRNEEVAPVLSHDNNYLPLVSALLDGRSEEELVDAMGAEDGQRLLDTIKIRIDLVKEGIAEGDLATIASLVDAKREILSQWRYSVDKKIKRLRQMDDWTGSLGDQGKAIAITEHESDRYSYEIDLLESLFNALRMVGWYKTKYGNLESIPKTGMSIQEN